MDWTEFNRAVAPALIQVVVITLGGIGTVIGVYLAGIAAKINKAKDAEVAAKETESWMADFNRGKEVAKVAVLSAEQNPEVQGPEEKLDYAMDAMEKTVPKLGNGLHRKLVEAAVIEATHGTEAPIGMDELTPKGANETGGDTGGPGEG